MYGLVASFLFALIPACILIRVGPENPMAYGVLLGLPSIPLTFLSWYRLDLLFEEPSLVPFLLSLVVIDIAIFIAALPILLTVLKKCGHLTS